jgi:hypothetical protein
VAFFAAAFDAVACCPAPTCPAFVVALLAADLLCVSVRVLPTDLSASTDAAFVSFGPLVLDAPAPVLLPMPVDLAFNNPLLNSLCHATPKLSAVVAVFPAPLTFTAGAADNASKSPT